MRRSWKSTLRQWLHRSVRLAVAALPRPWRFALYRRLITCDTQPDPRLELKIADTQAELEACFSLLHDAYVAAGFMKPDPSGLRVTPYHALPTTTTLCAKFDGKVVGTLSLIRDGVLGFPMQSAFDLTQVRLKPGQIAEVSALAVSPEFRKTGGTILFPLMKFMYEYCTQYFDTRHLLIAVNPNKVEFYEALLLFERLQAQVVARYDFANGAPAVGAALDLRAAHPAYQRLYAPKAPRLNLFGYFVEIRLPNIKLPSRPYHTTNDPVLTPALLDHFFNQRTQVFAKLDERRKALIRSLYDLSAYAHVLPPLQAPDRVAVRRHPRFTVRCPAVITVAAQPNHQTLSMTVVELSRHGLRAECAQSLPLGSIGQLEVELGVARRSTITVMAIRQDDRSGSNSMAFRIEQSDAAWLLCVLAIESGQTHADLAQPPGRVKGQAWVAPVEPVGQVGSWHVEGIARAETIPAQVTQPLPIQA